MCKTDEQIGARVKELRESFGESIEQFAVHTGVPASAIQGAESGGFISPNGNLTKIARSCGVSIHYFYERADLVKNAQPAIPELGR